MLQNCSIVDVAKIFFEEPTKKHYLIEVSKKSKLAHTSTKKHLLTLEKRKIIKKVIEKKGKRNFPSYMADLDNPVYKQEKKISNFSELCGCGLIEFLRDKFMPQAIVAFGSYIQGEDIETSDIDIFVESKEKHADLTKFEKILKRRIELHFNKNFNNYPKELKNNILNGIILNGYLEGFK